MVCLGFWIIKNAFLWYLNDPLWPGNIAESWKTFSSFTICNIKSIYQTKLQKIAKNLIFGLLDHSKKHFYDLCMILHDLVTLPKVGKHLVLSQYAISRRSNRPNSRKWPKTSFLAFWIIQKCIFLLFKWSRISDTIAKSFRPFSFIKICNIKSIWCTKLNKLAKNLIFGYLYHSKRLFCVFWMIQHGWYDGQLMHTI